MNINGVIKKNKKLQLQEKWSIVAYSSRYRDPVTNKLIYGALNHLTERFNYSEKAIRNVLKEYDSKLANGDIFINLSPSSRENCGVPSRFTDEVRDNLIDLHHMTKGELGVRELRVLYLTEFGIHISKSSMQEYLDKLKQTYRSSYVKPSLTEAQKFNRLQFILGKIINVGHGVYRFKPLKNVLHVDEKWFYVTKLKKKRRVLPDDDKFDDDSHLI